MSDSSPTNARLKSFIERIERLEEERKVLGADIREVYNEAKSAGFDAKIMRKVIALRKLDPAERAEMEALMAVYQQALGDLAETPMGKAAVKAEAVKAAETVRAGRGGKKAPKADGGSAIVTAKTSVANAIVSADTESTRPSQSADTPMDEASTLGNTEAGAGEQSGSSADADPTFDEEASATESAYQRVKRLSEAAKAGTLDADDDLEIPGFLKRQAQPALAAAE